MAWRPFAARGGATKRGGRPTAERLAEVLRAVGDPVRLEIVRRAAERERACNEFGLDLPVSTLSHHFKVLVDAGVIDRRREGTRLLTFVRRPQLDREFPGLLDVILGR